MKKRAVPTGLKKFKPHSDPLVAFVTYWINTFWIAVLLLFIPVGVPLILQAIMTPDILDTSAGTFGIGLFIVLMAGIPIVLGFIGGSVGLLWVMMRSFVTDVYVYNGDIYYYRIWKMEVWHQDIVRADIVKTGFLRSVFFKYGKRGMTPLFAKKYVRLRIKSRSKFPFFASIYTPNKRFSYVYLAVDDSEEFLKSISPVDRSNTRGFKRYLGKKKKVKKGVRLFNVHSSPVLKGILVFMLIIAFTAIGLIILLFLVPLVSFMALLFAGISVLFIALKAPFVALFFLPFTFFFLFLELIVIWIYIKGLLHNIRLFRVSKKDYLITVDRTHVVVDFIGRGLVKREMTIPIASIRKLTKGYFFWFPRVSRFHPFRDRWISTISSLKYVRIDIHDAETRPPFHSKVFVLPVEDGEAFIAAVRKRMGQVTCARDE